MIMHFQKNWFWAHNNPSFIKHQEIKAFIYGQNINNGEASQKLFDTSLLKKTIVLSFESFPTKQRMGLSSKVYYHRLVWIQYLDIDPNGWEKI